MEKGLEGVVCYITLIIQVVCSPLLPKIRLLQTSLHVLSCSSSQKWSRRYLQWLSLFQSVILSCSKETYGVRNLRLVKPVIQKQRKSALMWCWTDQKISWIICIKM